MMADAALDLDLTPEARALEGAAGVPAVLADGRAWLLCDGGLLNELDDLRDKLDDEARLSGGTIGLLDIANVAARLLEANYRLTPDEIRALLVGAVGPDRAQALADAVMLALFGPDGGRRTYTSWAASALIANGIDPSSVPSALRPHVLAQLEATGRCIKRTVYIESAEAGRRIAGIRSRVAAGPVPEPASGAVPDPAIGA